jgi:hypothetical protein
VAACSGNKIIFETIGSVGVSPIKTGGADGARYMIGKISINRMLRRSKKILNECLKTGLK